MTHFALRLVVPALLAVATPVRADLFIVTTTADSGAGSLRQALLAAEANAVADTIAFDIAGCGAMPPLCTIRPSSPLPRITRGAVTIDGYTQPGASENTLATGSNARLAIELDGSLASDSDGFVVGANGIAASGSGSIIRGLVINRFAGSGITLEGQRCDSNQTGCFVRDVHIEGCFIGTDASGNHPEANGVGGVALRTNAIDNVIGDSAATTTPIAANRNIISGNASYGILADTGNGDALYPARGNIVRNNSIGPGASAGVPPIGNGMAGIDVAESGIALLIRDNLIGYNALHGVAVESAASDGLPEPTVLRDNAIIGNAADGVHVSGDGLVGISGGFASGGQVVGIAYNGAAGVYVDGDAAVDIVAVPLVGNGGLGIDLAPAGPNANDDQDADVGPNERQNQPVLASARFDRATHVLAITGTIGTTPGTDVFIDYYLSEDCDASGYGEGAFPVASSSAVRTDARGDAGFAIAVSTASLPGRYLTALARRARTTGPGIVVSELSACRPIELDDTIFANGFDP